MNISRTSIWRWLTAFVLIHLIVAIVHGVAHDAAQVPLSRMATLFVFIVIVAGPLVGLAFAWLAERLAAWIIAITMAGALVFGIVNHFVIASPDHVAHVIDEWRALFTITAVLLAVTEGLASVLAIRIVRGGTVTS